MPKPYIFSGPNCAGCIALVKVLEEAGFKKDEDYTYIDAMSNMDMARSFNVRGFPTTIFFDEREAESGRIIGGANNARVVERMKEV